MIDFNDIVKYDLTDNTVEYLIELLRTNNNIERIILFGKDASKRQIGSRKINEKIIDNVN